MRKHIFFLLSFIYFSITSHGMKVDYLLEMSKPNTHYFEVTMFISDVKGKTIDIKMPVWAPGSYLVREFAKGVNLVTAEDAEESATATIMGVEKVDKNTWRVATGGIKSIRISYQVYSYELSVRTSFLDDSHGYINGTSVFMYVDGAKDTPGKLTIIPHSSFSKISTALKRESGTTYTFSDYDELGDCPIEIGNQYEFTFEAAGVKHTVCMYGEANYDEEMLKRDMAKIVVAETKVFGTNPNEDYLFIIHNVSNASGGLEHKSSTSLMPNRWTYEGDRYLRFLSLVAHEYFHLWNVKRMRPKELGPFDYDNENYTDLLWVMEGFTSYYDELILLRAGLYDKETYMAKLIGTINYVENSPGNKVQPVAHSSFDAWIKAYRRNENSVNTGISYYSKGHILAAMLDLYTINKFNGEKCLDHFLQKLYADFYLKADVGFTDEEFQSTLESFLGEDMNWFFMDYVYDTKTIDYKKFFRGVGLNFENGNKTDEPYLGLRTSGGAKLMITGVDSGTAGEEYGLSVNDEIIAINGYRVNKGGFDAMMATLEIGDEFEVMVARDNIIKTYKVKMGSRKAKRYKYEIDFKDDDDRKRYQYWLREDT
ncbi:M61 family metallopeptidase [Crocinitomix catalasitica]|nr:M61 family metallopeptidase [Crocinitomix catalasitica]